MRSAPYALRALGLFSATGLVFMNTPNVLRYPPSLALFSCLASPSRFRANGNGTIGTRNISIDGRGGGAAATTRADGTVRFFSLSLPPPAGRRRTPPHLVQ